MSLLMARGRKKEQHKSFPVSPSHCSWKLLSTGPAFKQKYYQEVVVVVEGSIFTVRLSVQRIFSTSLYYRILEWGY